MKVGISILPDRPPEEVLQVIELSDRLGFDAVNVGDEIYHNDPWQLLAAAATRTEQIELTITTNVVLHEPSYVAQRLLTLDALSNGRAAGLYSIGNPAMLAQHGVDVAGLRMIGRLREAHKIMRSFLDEGRVDFVGRFFDYQGLSTSARGRQARIPLTMAAMTGPKTFELAGEVADGMTTGLMYSEESLQYGVDCVKRGAERAGRDWTTMRLGAGLVGTISPDGDAARAVCRIIAAFYIPAMADTSAERHGIDPQELRPVRNAFARGDIEAAIRLAPDHVTDKLMMPVGTPTEWIEQLQVLRPLGYNRIELALVDNTSVSHLTKLKLPRVPTVREQLHIIQDEVLSALRSSAHTG